MQMRTRLLGSSDIEVSELGLGSWLTYEGGVGEQQAATCVRAAHDAGITFFDTANSYGQGAAESVLGRALRSVPRDSWTVATKVFMPMGEDHPGGLSAVEVTTQLDASLRRLGVDHIDLYQCHRFDPDVPVEETAEALTAAVHAGKVRAVGFSEWLPDQIEAGVAALAPLRFVSSQVQYNLLWRGAEREVFPTCAEHEISQILWSPLAQGVLTGKYLPHTAPPAGTRGADPVMSGPLRGGEFRFLADDVLAAVQQLRPVADSVGLTLAQLALAWVLRRGEVASAIIGASRPEQITQNVMASGVVLSEEVLATIDAVLGDAPEFEPQLVYRQRPGIRHRAQPPRPASGRGVAGHTGAL